jgi:hypothetical protein
MAAASPEPWYERLILSPLRQVFANSHDNEEVTGEALVTQARAQDEDIRRRYKEEAINNAHPELQPWLRALEQQPGEDDETYSCRLENLKPPPYYYEFGEKYFREHPPSLTREESELLGISWEDAIRFPDFTKHDTEYLRFLDWEESPTGEREAVFRVESANHPDGFYFSALDYKQLRSVAIVCMFFQKACGTYERPTEHLKALQAYHDRFGSIDADYENTKPFTMP